MVHPWIKPYQTEEVWQPSQEESEFCVISSSNPLKGLRPLKSFRQLVCRKFGSILEFFQDIARLKDQYMFDQFSPRDTIHVVELIDELRKLGGHSVDYLDVWLTITDMHEYPLSMKMELLYVLSEAGLTSS